MEDEDLHETKILLDTLWIHEEDEITIEHFYKMKKVDTKPKGKGAVLYVKCCTKRLWQKICI